MNRITQHFPPVADQEHLEDHVSVTAEFATKEDLLTIPFVHSFADRIGFYQYSVTDGGLTLMAEYTSGTAGVSGYKGLTVGTLDEPLPPGSLPEWAPPADHPNA